nr:ribosomal protein L7/L12 [Nocardioides ferulae]
MGWFSDRGDDQPDPSRIAQLEERVRRLEVTVALLAQERGSLPDVDGAAAAGDPWADVRDLVARGKKIQAIKVVRERTGMGLKEAKELVESW